MFIVNTIILLLKIESAAIVDLYYKKILVDQLIISLYQYLLVQSMVSLNHIELNFMRSRVFFELSVGKPDMSAGHWTSSYQRAWMLSKGPAQDLMSFQVNFGLNKWINFPWSILKSSILILTLVSRRSSSKDQ